MKPHQHKRQKVYVDRHVQGGIVLRLACIWLATTALAVFVSAVLQFFGDPTIGLDGYLTESSRYWGPTLMAFAAMLPIAALYLIRFTHRFVGPILRLRRVLRELADGERIPPIQFRDNDYWHDLAEEFNRVSAALEEARGRVAELETTTDKTCATGSASAV